jgi:hypothetical protein
MSGRVESFIAGVEEGAFVANAVVESGGLKVNMQ